jgi:hypothetical protein
VLVQLDEVGTCSEHWKILITAGMGFFADAYDLFVIGVAAALITTDWHVAGYQFGPNTTTFVYPAEIFPVQVRTTSHGIAAAAGKMGAFTGTYALTALLPVIGFRETSAFVAGVSLLGLLVTVTLLPEPKGISLEELTEARPYRTGVDLPDPGRAHSEPAAAPPRG